MSGGIFLLDPAGELTEMAETAFTAEVDLQKLLADHPGLLPGDQIDPGTPRRWLLVCREVGIPDQDQGGARWALDHLFLDQDGVPTLVEVKRGTDPRTRREVVGQMLDYAANYALHWTAEALLFDASTLSRASQFTLGLTVLWARRLRQKDITVKLTTRERSSRPTDRVYRLRVLLYRGG